MAEIVIEKNVPVPSGRQPKKYFPFDKMEIGDSFAVPVPEGAQVGEFSAKVRTHAINWGRQNGAKFSVLLVDEQTNVRVWRVA